MARSRAGIETRRRILDAIRELLALKGPEGTTLKAICDQADVQPGSFYNLFESKEQAILTVVREAIEAVDPDPGHEGIDTMADLVQAYIRFMEDDPSLARIYISIAVGGGVSDTRLEGRVRRHHRERAARFADAFAREHSDLPKDRARRRGELLLAALNGLALSGLIDDEFDFRGHALELLH
ncbi:TetR/AcrR family transcriptional regulator [bacterium]|nr:TetR/AcrR family transcriptional regulator [bacterium]